MKTIKFAGNNVSILEKRIEVGDIAPNVVLCNKDFSEFNLNEYFGKNILLTIFPSVDTSVCAMQTKWFNQEASKLNNIVIITISVDLPPALDRFCASEGIENLITSSDYKYKDFAKKYGFLVDELQLLARGNVFIDPYGVVRYVEYVEEITHEPDYNKLLEFIKTLQV